MIEVYVERVGTEPWEVDVFIVAAERPYWNGCGIDPHWGFFEIVQQRRLRSSPQLGEPGRRAKRLVV